VAGLNFLDRPPEYWRTPLDVSPDTWTPVSVEERLHAMLDLCHVLLFKALLTLYYRSIKALFYEGCKKAVRRL
jgi:hypothetical protein